MGLIRHLFGQLYDLFQVFNGYGQVTFCVSQVVLVCTPSFRKFTPTWRGFRGLATRTYYRHYLPISLYMVLQIHLNRHMVRRPVWSKVSSIRGGISIQILCPLHGGKLSNLIDYGGNFPLFPYTFYKFVCCRSSFQTASWLSFSLHSL